jgi:hypothetical protein
METRGKLFQPAGSVYHCSDRVASHRHVPLLNLPPISSIFATCTPSIPLPSMLWRRERVGVEAFGRNHRVPLQWHEKT